MSPTGAVPPLIPGDANYESIQTTSLVSYNTIQVDTIVTQVISGLLPPTQGSDATNKDYVDGLINGIVWKNPTRIATTTNESSLFCNSW